MTIDSRINFLHEIYPTLYYSLDDRYSFGEGKIKEYSRRYDGEIILVPDMTVSDLSQDNNFLQLFENYSNSKAIMVGTAQMVVTLRSGVYPMNEQEKIAYAKQRNLKKGDYLVGNQPGGEDFQYFQTNDPVSIINGSGKKLGPDGKPMNLYNMGAMFHPIEADIAIKTLMFVYSVMTNAIDEFKEEILKQTHLKNLFLKQTSICGNCHEKPSVDVKGIVCSGCCSICYCSKTCQREHFTIHIKDCKAFQTKK